MKNPDIEKPIVVGTTKACFLLDCGKDKLYELLRAQEIESYLENDRRKITVRSINAFIERRLAAANGGEFQLSEKHNLPPCRRKKAA